MRRPLLWGITALSAAYLLCSCQKEKPTREEEMRQNIALLVGDSDRQFSSITNLMLNPSIDNAYEAQSDNRMMYLDLCWHGPDMGTNASEYMSQYFRLSAELSGALRNYLRLATAEESGYVKNYMRSIERRGDRIQLIANTYWASPEVTARAQKVLAGQ